MGSGGVPRRPGADRRGVGGRAAALLALATGCFGGTLLLAQDLLRPRSFPSLAVPGAGRRGGQAQL